MSDNSDNFEDILKLFENGVENWIPKQPEANIDVSQIKEEPVRIVKPFDKSRKNSTFANSLAQTRRVVESNELSEKFCVRQDVCYERLAKNAIQKISTSLLSQLTTSEVYLRQLGNNSNSE